MGKEMNKTRKKVIGMVLVVLFLGMLFYWDYKKDQKYDDRKSEISKMLDEVQKQTEEVQGMINDLKRRRAELEAKEQEIRRMSDDLAARQKAFEEMKQAGPGQPADEGKADED